MLLPDALLLLGPTGAGKSPLGDFLQSHGLHERRCVHFDFGARLRAVAAGTLCPAGLGEEGVAVVERVLEAGALLDATEFWIAEALLADFLAFDREEDCDLVVLNGLPRHGQQARAVDGRLRIRLVVRLACTAEVVLERIASNSGGDRAARTDDDLERIRARITRFEDRTLPLLEHYERTGAALCVVPVGVATRPRDIHAQLESLGPL